MLRNFEGHMACRTPRNRQERHVGLSWGAVAFLNVAFQTGSHNIVPSVFAPSGARHDVIDSEIVSAVPAVLARVLVSVKNVSPRETDLLVWNFDVGAQANNRRQRKIIRYHLAVMLDLLGFSFNEQNNGSPPTSDIQRLVRCIQHQYFGQVKTPTS